MRQAAETERSPTPSPTLTTSWSWGRFDAHVGSSSYYFPGSPTAIYSTRLAVSTYTGKAPNVRRASDNTTQDFVGTAFDAASANSFCAGTLCSVTKWYDQSGAGNDASQATAGSQPALLVVNGVAWLSFYGQMLNAASPCR